MTKISDEIVDFVTKWAFVTKQRPDVASKRFWDLMTNSDISEEGKRETLQKWIKETEEGFLAKEKK